MWGSRLADGNEVAARLAAELTARGLQSQIGVASYPDDGRSPHAIIARAAERARGEEHHAPAVAVASPETVMQTLRRLVERIAHGSISVLIQGETGVGKEVITEAIHNLSPRAGQPFLRLNCAALSETLLS